MANTIVEIQLPTGSVTPTLSLYSLSSDTTLANTGGADTLTQESNASGFWRATVTEALTGVYRVKVLDGSSNVLATGYVTLSDDTNTYRVEDTYSMATIGDQVTTKLLLYDPPTYDELLAMFQIALRSDAGILADRLSIIEDINSDVAGGGEGSYSNLSDSQEAFYNIFNQRITTARAGYLDNLNIGESVAGVSNVFSRSRATIFTGTGKTVYALIYNKNNLIYNGSSFVTYNVSNYSSYARSVSETGSSGVYSLALPTGSYVVEFRQQLGSSPATNDVRLDVMQA